MPGKSRLNKRAQRFGPLVLITLALAAFYASGLNHTLSAQGLAAHFDQVMAARAAHPVLSALIFTGVYTAIVSISVPASLWMSVPGGLLFGWLWGGALSWAASTLGATLAFVAARRAIDPAAADTGGRYGRFRAGFERNAFSCIIMLRLLPLPFFAVNMAAGAFRVKTLTFATASAVGLIPASFLFAALGETAADVLRRGGVLDRSFFKDPKILAVFAGFAVLSLLPVLVQRWRARQRS